MECPMEIDFGDGKQPFDIDFHPSNPIVAVGLVTGDLLLYRYTADSPPEKLLEVNAHSESCRATRFINDGQAIVTGSPDCSILATDVETGSTIARLENSHGDAVNRIINLTESTIASGDDKGCVKVWDTRQRTCCSSFHAHEEYISDMTFASDSMRLLATSGDGTLSVCNLRSSKLQTRSEFSEEELLSVVIMKNGRKVICGSQSGTLLLYSWGFFKDCSDRFVDLSGDPVDALLKLDEERVIAGSGNGLISLVGILPNRIIQPIAQHSEKYPVERLAFSHDKKYLGSISHDNKLKFWDMDDLLRSSANTLNSHGAVVDSDSDGANEMDMDDSLPKSSKGTKRKGGQGLSTSTNFFADLQ
ncbi:WD repeat-containing protein 55 [Rhododendron vialii]|uniref:WD repeat-containing protein 55 n=1 Tax=Rhododendron vialii TaxID=182163 RepID=UPI00265E618D|nr:WD repeat-containing protein 55 [Rhododendron vialii]